MLETEMPEMDDLIMNGSKMERKVRKAKEEKREKIRRLKNLVHINSWEDEDALSIADSQDTLIKFLKFIKDPMIKPQFMAPDFKVINNALIDAIKILEKFEIAEEGKLLTKI